MKDNLVTCIALFHRRMACLKQLRLVLPLLVLLSGFSNNALAFSDRVLVIVDDDVVTQSEFDYRYQLVLRDYQAKPDAQPPANLAEQLLDTMVSEKLQIQEARRRDIKINNDELDQAVERYAAQQGLSVVQLNESLVRQGQSFASFSQVLKENMLVARLNEYYAQYRVSVPDYEIDGFIERNNWGGDETEYLLAHILLPAGEENRQLAQDIVSQLRQGASFQQAVLTHSSAVNASQGGVIGWRKKQQLPSIFTSALEGLSVGQVSDVVSGPNGFHILKLQDQRGQATEIVQSKVKHILIKAETPIARKRAKLRLDRLRNEIMQGKEFSDLARIYSDDTGSAARGGDLGWVSSGQMVPPFERAYQALAIGELSQPVESRYGIHLIQVDERQTKNVTEQLVRARAENILRRQRAEREYSQWVRSLRDRAYIQEVNSPV